MIKKHLIAFVIQVIFVLQKGVKKSDVFISGIYMEYKFFSYFFTPSKAFKLEDYEEKYTDSDGILSS